ncbi:MAG: GTP cyclohydrolase I FolE2 [Candidatus Altiarchaeum hamiconexum]|uniref:GTP cyclohydrolase MptA n=1 Tax=Candidatus Altarchaeum hamiconexum TaxID=1803513 RepID=A0A8J7YTI2_9ARCH|nr:GTP cyclohydrolase I FolE2 [Candidatus Altarchaeum hamiconexum]NCN69238.1 GTP cyclohydrolase I FolE2 [Candidatus Altarchaeum hamiconexum]NCS90867.1 GTP cyclohydrolase I FolE2 [Candidatus Altarchaeum hamiconexum]NCT00747.1 GTP cyclohydrolase I FolE2 [Candidatus Altarchaeum hamiconexum]OIQ05913.1 MAG: GTP cyclohydrolase [Candidatus Altarchaeum sp. CG2_30_32_3053]
MDVQNSKPLVLLGLNKVGCKGIKKQIIRNGNILYADIDAYVDLAGDRKGIHMSRIIESIDEIIEKTDKKVNNCEDFCVEVAKNIAKTQNYAERSEVNLTANFTAQRNKFGKNVEKTYKVIVNGVVTLKENSFEMRKKIGCKTIGLNACPCAQETIKQRTAKKLKNLFGEKQTSRILSLIPLVTHNQRAEITLIVEMPAKEHVELEGLIDICENSFSSEIFEMLKRPDEASVVENAHRKPLFVEDSVREVAENFYKTYGNLSNGIINIKVKSFESIHPHDAFAECKISIEDLRKIFK